MKPAPDFEFIDAPGVKIDAPPKAGKPYDVIFMVNQTGESILRVRNPYGCNTETGCLYFNNQYQPVGPIQVISPLGNNFHVAITEDRSKSRDVLIYTLHLLEATAA